MKAAICTVCVTELDWRDAFARTALAGYRDVELLMVPTWHHGQPGEVTPQELRNTAGRAGVNIMALHAAAIDGSSNQALASGSVRCRTVSICIWSANDREVLHRHREMRHPKHYAPGVAQRFVRVLVRAT